MAKPTLVATYVGHNNWAANAAPTYNASVAMLAGDILVVKAAYADYQNTGQDLSVSQIGGTTITWADRGQNKVSSYCNCGIFTGTAPANQTVEVRVTVGSGGSFLGFILEVWRDSDGVGNVMTPGNAATGAISGTLTTSGANSAISMLAADWSATGGTTRTPQAISGATFTENVWYAPDGSQWGVVGGYYDDVGAAGSKTVGWSSPSNWKWTFVAVEILGTGGPAATVDQQAARFGADDGSESAHTWLAAQSGNVTHPLASAFLARFLLQATGDFASSAFTLRAQKNGAGGYVTVPVGASTVTSPPAAPTGTGTTIGTAASSWAITRPSAANGDLVVFVLAWDDSTDTASVTAPAGPNGETAVSIAGPVASNSTEMRLQAWYYLSTGTWSGGTSNWTPSASETCRAVTFVVPAGQFNASDPIGWANTAASAGTAESNVNSPTGTAESNDGDGRIYIAFGSDADAITVPGSNWNTINNTTGGGVGLCVGSRNTLASNSESVAALTATIASDSWASLAFVVKPAVVTNHLYVAASSNIAAGGEATTNRLTGGTDTFVAGRRWDDENGTDTLDLTLDDFTEVEWSLNTQSPAVNGDYWDFRVYAGSTALANYDVTPRLTLGSAGTQALEGGAVGGGTASGNLGVVTFPAGARAALLGDDPDLAYAYAEIERAVEIYLPMYRAATGGTQALAGNALAASLATGALSVAKALAGSAAGAAAATGALGVAKPIAGAAQGAGTAAGALAVIKPLAGAATGAGSAAGLLALVKSLAGSATGAGTAAGDLSQQGQVDLLGAAIAQGTATGELAHGVPLTATAVAASVVAGALGVGKPLAGAAQGAGQASGALVLGIGLQAAAVGAGSGSGTLSTQGQVDLAGAAQGAGTATGAASVGKPLSGAATGSGTAAGVLTLTVRLTGAATGAGTAAGSLSVGNLADLSGNAQGSGQATAVLEVQIPLTGAAIAQAQAQGGLALAVRLTGEAIAAAVASGRLSVNGDAIELSGAALASAQAAGVLTSLIRFGLDLRYVVRARARAWTAARLAHWTANLRGPA